MHENKIGLILSEEALNGAYETGVAQALCEMAQPIAFAAGAAFGAVTAALIAQNDAERLTAFWQKSGFAPLLELNAVAIAKCLTEWRQLDARRIHDAVFSGALDLEAARASLNKFIDEATLRTSDIGFGLLAFDVETAALIPMSMDQIPEGALIDLLITAIAMPDLSLFSSNTDILSDSDQNKSLLFQLADQFEADTLMSMMTPAEGTPSVVNGYRFLPIKSSEYIESTLPIPPETITHYMLLGALDCKKAFKKLEGRYYYFDLNDEHPFFDKFNAYFNQPDPQSSTWHKTALLLGISGNSGSSNYFKAINNMLNRTTYPKGGRTLFHIMEMAGRILGIERCRCYSPDAFLYELLLQIETIAAQNATDITEHPFMTDEVLSFSNLAAPIRQPDFIAYYFIFVQDAAIKPTETLYQILKHATPEFALAMLLLLKLHEYCKER